jgi:hypothetical protein
MNVKLLLLCLATAANASAADSPAAPKPQPLAPAAPTVTRSAVVRRLPPPTVSETSVTRRADGSLAMNCVQKPNPKFKQGVSGANPVVHAVESQQP